MKKVLCLLMALTIAAVIAACGEISTPEKAPAVDTGERKPPQQEIFAIGDRVAIGDFYITVKKAYVYAGSQWNKPQDGEKWIVVDVELENCSDEAKSISSLMMFSIFDPDNYKCDIAINVDAKGSLDGEIGAGRKMAGELTFSVLKEHTSFEFIFEPDLVGKGQAIYQLENLE